MSSTRPSESKPKLSVEELADLVATMQTEMLAFKYERDTQVESLQETIVNLAHENELLKRRLFGTKTEKLRTSENQLALGDLLSDECARAAWMRALCADRLMAFAPAGSGRVGDVPRAARIGAADRLMALAAAPCGGAAGGR